jgi:hypothetical protein
VGSGNLGLQLIRSGPVKKNPARPNSKQRGERAKEPTQVLFRICPTSNRRDAVDAIEEPFDEKDLLRIDSVDLKVHGSHWPLIDFVIP